MRKGNIKIYDLNFAGKYKLSERLDEKEFVTKSNEKLANNQLIKEKMSQELFYNPFLCEINIDNSDIILNVEDLYIMNNNSSCTFASIIQSDYYTKREKKKIVKKQIKKWKNDVAIKLNELFKKSTSILQISKKADFLEVNFLNKFLLLIGIVIPVILLLNCLPFISFDNKINKICAVIIIFLSLLGFVFCYFQNKQKRIYIDKISNHKVIHKRIKEILRKFKKNSNLLEKYYKSGYKNNQFIKQPLPIKFVQIDEDNLQIIENSIDDIQKYYNTNENNKVSSFSYYMAKFLSYFVSITSGGYIVIMLLVYLFKIIFMKGE